MFLDYATAANQLGLTGLGSLAGLQAYHAGTAIHKIVESLLFSLCALMLELGLVNSDATAVDHFGESSSSSGNTSSSTGWDYASLFG